MEYETAGDPITGAKWTHRTPEKIASILRDSLNISVSGRTVARLLKDLKFSLKSNRKIVATTSRPERNAQFMIVHAMREMFMDYGHPIISVDTKKKEMLGKFKNPGVTWTEEYIPVYDHDFLSCADGRAIPYGIYDIQKNLGYVFVGLSYDTPEFAVNSIASWWRHQGRRIYPKSDKVLILADCGGSNGYRAKAWKHFLQTRLADSYNLAVTVAHYPPGCSKYNLIEHRLFSEIQKNWKGRPLDSVETVLNYIRTTHTKTGLRVRSYLDKTVYSRGVTISDEQMDSLSLLPAEEIPSWNYTIFPRL